MFSKKKVLIIQLRPEEEASNNEFEAILKYGNLGFSQVRRIRAEKTGIPPLRIKDYAAVIVGGSPFDISVPETEKSKIQKKIEQDFNGLFKDIVADDVPFLGACSGIGLLGKYCGTSISTKYGEPVGALDIILTPEGRQDPILKNIPPTFRAIAGHKEACDTVPVGAVLLASSKQCPVHMFRIKKNIYATQFHPELDAQGVAIRAEVYKHHGYFSPSEAKGLREKLALEKTPHAQQILRQFIARYVK